MLNAKSIILGIMCLFLASCVTSQSDIDTLRYQVRVLERQQQQDRQDMTRRLEDYQAQLKMVDEMISETEGTAQTTQAGLWADVESMKVQVATLTGRLDSLEKEYLETRQQRGDADQILQELRARTRELDRSVQMISSQLGVEIAEAEVRTVPDPVLSPDPADDVLTRDPADEWAPAPARADSARVLYQRALDSFYERDYERAQALWEEFTDNFADHVLTANAHFWQGESFFQLQDYARAALAYQEVIINFPESNKINSSMLKQGMSFFRLGRKEAGELILNELIRKFPDTAEAARAKSFMADHQ